VSGKERRGKVVHETLNLVVIAKGFSHRSILSLAVLIK
jgi:hypothetical protein